MCIIINNNDNYNNNHNDHNISNNFIQIFGLYFNVSQSACALFIFEFLHLWYNLTSLLHWRV